MNTWFYIGIGIIALFVIFWFFSHLESVNRSKKKWEGLYNDQLMAIKQLEDKLKIRDFEIREIIMQFNAKEANLKLQSQEWAIKQLDEFKQKELEEAKKIIEENALKAASNLFTEWKLREEKKIREEAIKKSNSVHYGKAVENLCPFYINFPFNVRDARFIGSPIDLIVFDGLTDKSDNITICLVEIKTVESQLSEKQRKIKEAIENKRIEWYLYNPDEFDEIARYD